MCGNIFKINESRDILNFGDITVPEIVLHNEIIHKTQTKTYQEHSAHCFGDNYLTDHLVKVLQDRIKP